MSSGNNRLKRRIKRHDLGRGISIELDNEVPDMSKAINIPYRHDPESKPLQCWHNVARYARENGGRSVWGFIVDEYPGYWQLRAHVIWEAPSGERWDITPARNDESPVSERMFLEHKKAGRGKKGAPLAMLPKPGMTAEQHAAMLNKLERQVSTWE